MNRSSFALLALLLLLALSTSACDSATEPGSRLLLSTTQSSFTLAPYLANVSFTVTNEESSSVYLARCGDRIVAVVDRWEGNRWAQYMGGLCQADRAMVPLELAPRETAAAETEVGEAGRYRLRVGKSFDPGDGPDWNTTSNAFSVEQDAQ